MASRAHGVTGESADARPFDHGLGGRRRRVSRRRCSTGNAPAPREAPSRIVPSPATIPAEGPPLTASTGERSMSSMLDGPRKALADDRPRDPRIRLEPRCGRPGVQRGDVGRPRDAREAERLGPRDVRGAGDIDHPGPHQRRANHERPHPREGADDPRGDDRTAQPPPSRPPPSPTCARVARARGRHRGVIRLRRRSQRAAPPFPGECRSGPRRPPARCGSAPARPSRAHLVPRR